MNWSQRSGIDYFFAIARPLSLEPVRRGKTRNSNTGKIAWKHSVCLRIYSIPCLTHHLGCLKVVRAFKFNVWQELDSIYFLFIRDLDLMSTWVGPIACGRGWVEHKPARCLSGSHPGRLARSHKWSISILSIKQLFYCKEPHRGRWTELYPQCGREPARPGDRALFRIKEKLLYNLLRETLMNCIL